MNGWKFAVECPRCSAYVEVAPAPDGPASAIRFADVVTQHACPICGHTWECSASAAFPVKEDRCATADIFEPQ
jgi:endogenous inhibitor of DNA gyrase (YacG/DUF329 family)